jgi:sulfate permease, SulP family
MAVFAGARTEDGLAVYRFGTNLYYANAHHLVADIPALASEGSPLRWVVLDAAAIGDVDYTAAVALIRTIEDLRTRHSRFVISNALTPVRKQLDRYGISDALGPDAYYGTADEALEAFHATEATSSD